MGEQRDSAEQRRLVLEDLPTHMTAAGDSRREILDQAVEVLKETIDIALPSERAALMKQLLATVDKREALPAAVKPDPEKGSLDELRSRREARHSGTADPAPASKRGQSRRRAGGNRVG